MGSLTISTATPRSFSLDGERVLQTLADHVTPALINTQLYAQLQQASQGEQTASQQKSAVLQVYPISYVPR
jgi:GAF domain-containing protein